MAEASSIKRGRKMYKRLIYFSIFCVVLLFVCSCQRIDYEKAEEELYEINLLIKDTNFNTGKVEGDMIFLYNEKNEKVKEVKLNRIFKTNIKSIRKEKNLIYFVLSGSVDDEDGIVFINDNVNDVLDGVKTIKRIGGNSYQYSSN